jgi:regulator of protease activity HflC (stomatin/prohibitin superfamily)
VVHYVIADPARYFFGVRDGEALVRMMSEGTLRNLVASFPLDTLLTTDRQVLQDKWADALRARLKAVDAGVEILGLHLADVHPPSKWSPRSVTSRAPRRTS